MNEISLSKTAADQCVSACKTYLDGLQVVVAQCNDGLRKGGFGDLPSGVALGRKFSDVAIGQSYSLDTVLRQHIEVIQRLQSAFEAAGQRYIETDTQNAANLTARQPK